VLFFNASTRIWGLSQNAAFSLLAAWGLRLGGVPVRYLVCEAGMEQCVLGAIARRPDQSPPCGICRRLSSFLFPPGLVEPLYPPSQASAIRGEEHGLENLEALLRVEKDGLPLGELCLPSLRWVLRRHNLIEDAQTLGLYRRYIRSAAHIADVAQSILERLQPRAVVVFNGVSFPEAIVRETALRMGIPVITHEVGIRPLTAFFTHGQATAYPIEIPDEFQMSPQQKAQLDAYLEDRFHGRFTMAGIQFWPEMEALGDELLSKIESYERMVVVFTNVIFDTSQVHANILFEDMFDWLRSVVDFAREHPETLFIVRAHPDELRPGKESQETVEEHLAVSGGNELPNLVFLGPRRYVSSYDLIRRAKLVMVYNSTIGLEATLLGKVVLCGGKARYTSYPTAYLPDTIEEYFSLAEQFMGDEDPRPPTQFIEHARRFTYFQHYLTSLDFSAYLAMHPEHPGYVVLKRFAADALHPHQSEETRIILDGITEGAPMRYGYPAEKSDRARGAS